VDGCFSGIEGAEVVAPAEAEVDLDQVPAATD
jgi:hypothetical protein